jgi:hypothetical protein
MDKAQQKAEFETPLFVQEALIWPSKLQSAHAKNKRLGVHTTIMPSKNA